MRSLVFFVITQSLLLGQAFNSKMPETVPAVTGTPVQNLNMHYIDITPGTGAVAAPAKQFTVHYTGWLRNGTKFDSSVDRKEPLKFVQGRRQLISGWEVGFEGMKVGGKRRLFIPYQLAYGELGRGSIPPKAELIFDVELLDVSDPPASPASADVLASFSEYEKKVMDLAKAVPADKYSWRPAPGVRSFGEVFVHITSGNRLLLSLATSSMSADAVGKLIEEQSKTEKQNLSKEKIIEMLTESFAAVRKHLETVSAGALSRETDFFGTKVTTRTILVNLDTHIAEHMGQAIAYARMNGIVPPWSK
jgi:uncharacterized damage-inducible protein DinB